MVHFVASFWKFEACVQTVLPDMSVLIGQKLVENAKIKKKIKLNLIFKQCEFETFLINKTKFRKIVFTCQQNGFHRCKSLCKMPLKWLSYDVSIDLFGRSKWPFPYLRFRPNHNWPLPCDLQPKVLNSD